MNKIFKLTFASLMSVAAAACGDDGNATPDAPPVTPDTPVAASGCQAYCDNLMANCTGANAQYADAAECKAYCDSANWPDGTEGAQSGNSKACRIYHGGAPAAMDPGTHCSHAGPTGDAVCGAVDFRTDAPTGYNDVDSVGMPGAQILIPVANRNAYNDQAPQTVMPMNFQQQMLTTIAQVHGLLDGFLTTRGYTVCTAATGPTSCLEQPFATGGTVSYDDHLIPTDRLRIDTAQAAGFPNGRQPQDQAMDITLATLLVNFGASCGAAGTCAPNTLATKGSPSGASSLNPAANDVPFLTTFPYLAAPKAP